MPHALAVVQFEMESHIPEDRVQNTWAFTVNDPIGNGTTADAITAALDDFYTGVGTQTHPVCDYLSPAVSQAADGVLVSIYDVGGHEAGTPHGAPALTRTFSLTGVGTDPLPSELAICLSFHSDYAGDVEFGAGTRPRARDRGRVYLGPLAQTCITRDTDTNEAVIKATVRADIAQAAQRLNDEAVGFETVTGAWCVWSRRDATFKTVTGGWVDDAFDVQRRRGIRATRRSTFP